MMIRIYLDNCCFNRPYDDQSHLKIELETKAKLKIQEMVIAGQLELVTSFILEQENDDNPYLERKIAIEDFLTLATIDIDLSQEIIDIANETGATGLKTKDSLHLACAIVADCEYLLTTDKRFLKCKDTRIKVVNPVQFVFIAEV
jgi:predicted nucleic acid-binding protein